MNKKNTKMNTKRILVSFLLIASVLFLASTVSAANIADSVTIKVDGADVATSTDGIIWNPDYTNPVTPRASVSAGDTIEVKVYFTADVTGSDVKVKATLEGNKDDVTEVTSNFDVIDNRTYVKTLTLKVPSDFDDENLNEPLTLNIKIWNSDDETESQDIELELQRPSYDVAIKSVMTSLTIEAGQLVPVDVVLKNIGYNDLEDVYVTAKISGLNIQKTAFFGDIVTVDNDDDDEENTVSGRLYLEIPYDVKSGTYTLEVTAENDETSTTVSKDMVVENGFPDLAMKSGNDLVLLNPTNQLKVYKVVYDNKEFSVIVPAASSKTVTIETPVNGEYNFDVAVFSGDNLLSTVKFSGVSSSTTTQLTSPVMVLTIILAVVFFVLLVVLVVLITKKPQKTEEFGESYY